MRRHKSFFSRGELVDYVRSMVPRHVYHSAAYYQRPGAPTMNEKLWQGADLIFDLDADHLRSAPESYAGMLAQVKKETEKLLTFLLSDFGFAESRISLAFSGGRGYHIHVRDQRIFSFGGEERREIVDYLSGRGLSMDRFIHEAPVEGWGGAGGRRLRAPAQDSPGWGGRINRSILSFVEGLRILDEPGAVAVLSRVKGIGPKRASSFYRSLQGEGVIEEIRRGNLDLFRGSAGIWKLLLKNCLENEGVAVGFNLDRERGETDEPVTADVRRLIRCPGSLHGGSGLRATPLSIKDLEEFDPLQDAVVFGDEPVALEILKPFSTQMKGNSYSLREGAEELPLYLAVFLMGRGVAEARTRL
ncbi:MAG: DNA primase small subunit PriS [Methanothrix sp.]|uniref:DNA primase small subunit domain-containing protein n=1 Tax=Methanothrix sp. TaxID=90426 RepID=UPI003BB04C7A